MIINFIIYLICNRTFPKRLRAFDVYILESLEVVTYK